MAIVTNRTGLMMHSSTRSKENRVAGNDRILAKGIGVVCTCACGKRRDRSCSVYCAIAHVEITASSSNDKIHLVTNSGKSSHGGNVAEA